MANMSYCRFENTARDLSDCAEHIIEPLSSSYEKEGRESLVAQCIDILKFLGCEIHGTNDVLVNSTDAGMLIEAAVEEESNDGRTHRIQGEG